MASTTLIDHASELPAQSGGEPPRHEDLYAKRKQIYPKLAHGKFRTIKWIVMAATLGVYYGLPWVRWNRGEGIPDQAVLADFSSEKFYFFFIELWPQDIHYMAGGLILASLLLFLVTSLLGRVWCGYTCPQTVWTDLYIWVERAFEGDRATRMRLDKAPWTANKIARKLGKHAVWLVIAFWTGGAFILYWHDAPTVAAGWFTGDAPLTAYWFAGILTLTTYFLAGTMREQVCTYMCPWPRIQGALTDEQALNVTYRYDRGEPRGPKRKSESWDDRGDCIDCNQCVQVCPMGIDIRDGEQLECIHCALCIDACDEIMAKVDRPKGLIAYDTQIAVAARNEGLIPPKHKLIRARTVVYAVVML
ncbi:cytochrome c oxidase accessory protein CcoG, partial [Hyphomonas sp. UBA1472]